MADEFTIDAKYKRDNLVAEHARYRMALEVIESEACGDSEWTQQRLNDALLTIWQCARQALRQVEP